MRLALLVVGVLLLAGMILYGAVASYIEISDEDLVAQSDLVIVGKIVKINEGGSKPSSKSIATIDVEKVLKGEKSKAVKLAFPSRRRNMMASTDIFYKKGQEGVWLLTKDKEKGYFHARHPARFQPKENAKKIASIIEEQKNGAAAEEVEEAKLDAWKKKIIDEWIAENNLNRYGDPKNTVYAGGTPLFDEKTGRSIDRYDYIYMEHAEVRKLIAEKAKEAAPPPDDVEIEK